MSDKKLPLGFGMALAQNETAMRNYAALSEAERDALLRKTHAVQSKDEMHRLVADLAERPIPSGVYPVIDTDLARDNVENDLPAADRQEL